MAAAVGVIGVEPAVRNGDPTELLFMNSTGTA